MRIVFRLLDRPSVTLPAKQKNRMYRANIALQRQEQQQAAIWLHGDVEVDLHGL
ncbi:MAG: hypothetical protein ACLUUF_02205 [Bifidobacterium pullorum]